MIWDLRSLQWYYAFASDICDQARSLVYKYKLIWKSFVLFDNNETNERLGFWKERYGFVKKDLGFKKKDLVLKRKIGPLKRKIWFQKERFDFVKKKFVLERKIRFALMMAHLTNNLINYFEKSPKIGIVLNLLWGHLLMTRMIFIRCCLW